MGQGKTVVVFFLFIIFFILLIACKRISLNDTKPHDMDLVDGAGNNHSKDISLRYVGKRARIFTRRGSYDHQRKGFSFYLAVY